MRLLMKYSAALFDSGRKWDSGDEANVKHVEKGGHIFS